MWTRTIIYDLGINTREKDRLKFRKIITCAPIRAEEYATDWTSTPPAGGPELNILQNSYKYYYMGERTHGQRFTWAVSNHTLWNVDRAQQAYNLG